MATLVCPRCRRLNPAEAVFCYFDGLELRAPAQRSAGHLPNEFIFPSGRRCRTYDDLARGCREEWSSACDLLRKGAFSHFLTTSGRMDLVRAAEKAQSHADPDLGLHFFLDSLPATKTEGPRLDLQPRRLILGTFYKGETRQVRLTVLNQGQGLLHGSLSISSGRDWLRLVDGAANGRCALKTLREQQVLLHVQTQDLAAPGQYGAKLTIVTNGGIVEMPVSLDLAAHPFSKAPFLGVSSPREMAEQMRKQPKAAVPLLENGDLRRWFGANGWTYPVTGPQAPGVAAVQQFFEGMGLSRPPALQLSEEEVSFVCVYPELAQGQVTLLTPTKKWVYAQVESDAPWLKVQTPVISGPRQAVIAFEVDSGLMDVNRIYVGKVQVFANAGQTLTLRVRVDVRRPYEPLTRRLLRPFLSS